VTSDRTVNEEPVNLPDLLLGRVAWVFGDDFDVDLIIGTQNIKSYEEEFLLSVCMNDYESDFVDKVEKGDLIVGGRNFGYGHPHYPPLIALRAAGIVAIVADSFAPGFWRGETYNGLPLIICPGISDYVERWDTLEVDWRSARVSNIDKDMTLEGEPPSKRTIQILESGGTYPLLLSEYSHP